MIVYWILLLIIAFFSYFMGSLSTMNIASAYVFRRDLRRLGRGNVWISNFRRIFGPWGFVKLLLVELIKDMLPLILGGLLMGIKEHGELGRAFAGFCLVYGRVFPVFNRFRGSYAIICLICAALFVNPSIGAFVAVLALAIVWFNRRVALAALVCGFVYIAAALLLVEDGLTMAICIFTGILVILKQLPAIPRLISGREEKLSFEEDISYKFDEKF